MTPWPAVLSRRCLALCTGLCLAFVLVEWVSARSHADYMDACRWERECHVLRLQNLLLENEPHPFHIYVPDPLDYEKAVAYLKERKDYNRRTYR